MANNIMPGEHDWMYNQPGVMGFPSPPPTAPAQGGGMLGKLGGGFGGLLGIPSEGLSPAERKAMLLQAMGSMGANLMAQSGWSPQRVSFGQALGNSLLATQQQVGQQKRDMMDAMLLRAKLQQKERKRPTAVMGPNGQPIFVDEQDAIGKQPYMKPGSEFGAYQPGDYTTESWAKFQQTKDPADLVRYATPRQEYSPGFQSISRTLPDGSTQQGVFNSRTGERIWDGEIVPPGQKKRVDAQAAAEGEAAGGQTAKAPAGASMEYVLGEMERQFENTMQGGIGGIFGKAGSVLDYKDKQRFDNLREQLSTELRTVYRIPGEGSLSDREQAQYGLQLPSTDNHSDVNRAIIRDLRERTRLRLQTPIGTAGSASTVERPPLSSFQK